MSRFREKLARTSGESTREKKSISKDMQSANFSSSICRRLGLLQVWNQVPHGIDREPGSPVLKVSVVNRTLNH